MKDTKDEQKTLADAAAKDGDKELKRETSVLLRSTDKAWLQAGTCVADSADSSWKSRTCHEL